MAQKIYFEYQPKESLANRDSEYKLVKEIGSGSYGKVYVALWSETNEILAVKRMFGSVTKNEVISIYLYLESHPLSFINPSNFVIHRVSRLY